MKFTTVFALATLVATISAHGDVVGVDNTNVVAEHVIENVANDLDAHNLGKNLNADVLSHVASSGGDSHRRLRPLRGARGDGDRAEEIEDEIEGEDD